MHILYHIKTLRFCTLFLLVNLLSGMVSAQSVYQPYSFQFYQKFNSDLYSTSSNQHTSLKPFFDDDSLLIRHYDSLMSVAKINPKSAFAYQKLFSQHLVDLKWNNSTFYADILSEFTLGKSFSHADTSGRTFSNTITSNIYSLGLQLGGTFGQNFTYNIAGFASTQTVPDYISTYIKQTGVIPGQGLSSNTGGNSYNLNYITATFSYTPSQYLNISAGRDKTFIGDGYRSLLLSDYSSPYLFFKLTATLGHLKYMAMWTDMNDPITVSQYGIQRNKFGVFHYLDWSLSNRLSFGFFENITGFFTDDNGVKRPFDFNYINPLIYMQAINNDSGDPDKSLLGFTGKYKISNGLTAYGQFALNEFHSVDFFSSNGSFTNKYAWQFGLRGTNLFSVNNLNFLVETNSAKPYTYSARAAIESYSNNGEPLAHPWGANFREVVVMLNYSYKRFDYSFESDFGRYGLDLNGADFGKNLFEVYTDAARYYGNYTTQGLTTNLTFIEGKVAYIINPKTNLRLELGGIFRVEKNMLFNNNVNMITFGVKSSFRSVYNDIASFKMH